ncbi:hypothetical protein DsansV1_C36g0232021 [Dioscorea sansibarensis]
MPCGFDLTRRNMGSVATNEAEEMSIVDDGSYLGYWMCGLLIVFNSSSLSFSLLLRCVYVIICRVHSQYE